MTGESDDFAALVEPYRSELHAHCYRMLGSAHDAEEALQETLLDAWRGLPGFEGRSSLRSWLYRVATHACIRLGKQRQRRLTMIEYCAPRTSTSEIGEPVTEVAWLEPYPGGPAGGPGDPAARYEVMESVELAFVAALQHLPARQRAVLLLRDVLAFSAEETADALETTVASANSALQRARKTLEERRPERSQQATLRDLGDERCAKLVADFVAAWERADVGALLELLAEDVRFSMPPLPAWFAGREHVGAFFADRVFATPWRLLPLRANGQLAFACYQQGEPGGDFVLGAVNVLGLRGDRIAEVTGFLDPAMTAAFGLTKKLPEDR